MEEFKLLDEVKSFVEKMESEHFPKSQKQKEDKSKDKALIILSFEEGDTKDGVAMGCMGSKNALSYLLTRAMLDNDINFIDLLDNARRILDSKLVELLLGEKDKDDEKDEKGE